MKSGTGSERAVSFSTSVLSGLALFGLLAFAGCGASPSASSNEESPPAGEESEDAPRAEASSGQEPAPPAEAPGVTVRGGAVFQGVKLPLFGEDAVEGALPIVVDRPGVFRLYVDLVDPRRHQKTRAVFKYKAKDGSVQELAGEQLIKKSSDDGDATTCIDVALPAEVFHPGLEYAAEVYDRTGRLVSRYPEAESTFAPLVANPQTKSLSIVIVPVQYTADGSDRLPDTSADQLQILSEEMRALYPVSEVDISVRSQPLSWPEEIRADGRGWDALLYGILELRESDNAADNVYYYGAFNPASSLQSFCSGGGCVLGLSELSRNVGDAGRRASIGLGYTGRNTAETFTHELGHAHGRYHAPCGGAGGPDQRYPYARGAIGVPGWDVRSGEFVPEGEGRGGTKDFMGYCSPAWVSDYTWKALFTRIVGIGEEIGPVASATKVRYKLLRIEDGKPPRWLGSRSASGTVGDSRVAVRLGNGESRELQQVELDHLPGHVVYVPAALSGQSIRLTGVASPITVP